MGAIFWLGTGLRQDDVTPNLAGPVVQGFRSKTSRRAGSNWHQNRALSSPYSPSNWVTFFSCVPELAFAVRRFVMEVELDGHTTENWALVLEIGPHVDGRNGELTRHLDSAKREG